MPTLAVPRLSARMGLALMAVCLAVFAAIASDLGWHGPVTRADIPINVWFHLHAQPAFTTLATAVSQMHSTLGICIMALAAAVSLALYRQAQWLPLLALSVPGGLVLNSLVKHGFGRARPSFEAPTLTLASYSFPSGHTAGATVWWGFAVLVWFAWDKRPARRALACAVAMVMILLTGLSRMVLGLHYLSDVLAAAAEGAAWMVLCMGLYQRFAGASVQEEAR